MAAVCALEDYLGTDLLLRGRSGLHPTAALEAALVDLRAAFAAVERVTETPDFQRVSELHLLADPVRLGAPDMRILRSDNAKGALLFHDVQVAVTGPDNVRRLGNWDQDFELEGLPLLHVDPEPGAARLPGWPEWVERHGHRREGAARGVHYRNLRLAPEGVRRNVGFLICSLTLAQRDLAAGSVVLVYPADRHLSDVPPFRLFLRNETRASAQVRRCADWLDGQAADTCAWINEARAGAARPQTEAGLLR